MNTTTYQGQLSFQDQGEATDILFLSSLEEPLAEELEWLAGKTVTVRYWITDEECSRDDAQESAVLTAMGAADVRYAVRYSDYTGYLWTDEDLKVGGHDLMAELRSHVGKWLILDVTAHA